MNKYNWLAVSAFSIELQKCCKALETSVFSNIETTRFVTRCKARSTVEALFDTCNEHVATHRVPDLRLDCILVVIEELLYAQMLFDQFEDQFCLPTVFLPSCSDKWRQAYGVDQKDKRLLVFGVVLGNVSAVR